MTGKKVVVVFNAAALALAFLFSSQAFACDAEGAVKLERMYREMGTWYEKAGVVTFKWAADWDEATPKERLGLISGFANTDACLTGKARPIEFYRKGKLVGKASPTWGIKLVE